MREIKFRAWDSENNIMIEWHDLFFYDTSVVTNYSGDFSEINMPLMQYTGLKDEEGVEIYEGDRYYFQAHNPIEGIFTEHENTVEDFIMDTMELMQLLDSDYISELLVIGNIHIDKQE